MRHRGTRRREEFASSVWWSPNGYVERGFFEVGRMGVRRVRADLLGATRPQTPRLQSPPERGLTPDGDVKKCETVLDSEQPLHGYIAKVHPSIGCCFQIRWPIDRDRQSSNSIESLLEQDDAEV